MKRSVTIVILLAFVLVCAGFINTKVKDDDNVNAHIKVTFLYNFTKYIEWPAAYKQGSFVIGVIGNTPVFPELLKMQRSKKKGNQSFVINKYSSVDAMGKCHMLYVSRAESSQLGAAVNKLKGRSTLIVTEKPGLIDKGAGINFVVANNKQGFELNKANIKGRGLSLSTSLTAFAVKVVDK